jgi:hypothetical protein
MKRLLYCSALLWNHDIWVWIQIRGVMPLTMDPDPAIFILDLQEDATKKSKFFCLLLFEGTFTSFLKDKKSLRSRKTVGIKVFLTMFA